MEDISKHIHDRKRLENSAFDYNSICYDVLDDIVPLTPESTQDRSVELNVGCLDDSMILSLLDHSTPTKLSRSYTEAGTNSFDEPTFYCGNILVSAAQLCPTEMKKTGDFHHLEGLEAPSFLSQTDEKKKMEREKNHVVCHQLHVCCCDTLFHFPRLHDLSAECGYRLVKQGLPTLTASI